LFATAIAADDRHDNEEKVKANLAGYPRCDALQRGHRDVRRAHRERRSLFDYLDVFG